MVNVLEKKDNYKKIEHIKSNLVYGKMIDNADFTLTIPVYGCNAYLHELLNNLVSQQKTELKIQIIISDNKEYANINEDNDVLKLLKKYNFDNLAYYLSEKSLGQFNNFNRSIELGKTPYVAMIHDDDLLVNNYFKIVETVLPFLYKHSKIGMIHAEFEFFNSNIQIHEISKTSIFRITNFEITHYGFTMTGIPSCGTIFNRRVFIEQGGFNDSFPASADAFLAGVMIKDGYKIMQFSTLTGYYRIGVNSSLRFDICKGFIEQDEMFRETWKSLKWYRRTYMDFFSNYIYSKNIDGKIRLFAQYNPEINLRNLDFKKSYKKYNKYGVKNISFIILSKLICLRNKIFRINFQVSD
jgi:hypothetical protein